MMEHIEAVGASLHQMRMANERSQMRHNKTRWLCDKHGITDEDGYRRILAAITHEEYMFRVQPLLDMKSRVLMFKFPRYLVHQDGRFEALPIEYTPEETKFLGQIDEMIAGVARELGLYNNAHPTTEIPAHTNHNSG